jgi:hypothetical protein
VTATVFTVTLADTVGFPTEVALIVDVSFAPSAAAAGTVTRTQTFVVAPAFTVGVAVMGVVQLESRKLTGKVPPELESEYESGV